MKISSFISRLCVAILAYLGYGCQGSLMYGTPTGSWEVKGEVTEQENSEPAAATIKVTIPDVNSSEYSIVETRTDEDGKYTASNTGISYNYLKVVCIPDDPSLKADSIRVTMKYSGGNKKDEWDDGNAEATANFRLKEKAN